MKKEKIQNSTASFTLIELLVVMLIIAILGGFTIGITKYAAEKAKKSRQNIYLTKIKSALEEYRSIYGEYPIIGNPNHYSTNYNRPTNPVGIAMGPIDLAANPVETIPYMGSSIQVDYSLTYPLCLRQLEEGKRPFMDFDQYAVLVVTKEDYSGEELTGKVKVYDRNGNIREVSYKQIKGYPIVRYQAVDPYSSKKLRYICSNGMDYIVTNW